jgi:hypothetical protein
MPSFGPISSLPISALPVSGGGTSYTLTCDAGAYVYSGQDATLTVVHNYVLDCEAGAYSYAGQDASLQVIRNYVLDCEVGAYLYAGQDATLDYSGAVVPADPTGIKGGIGGKKVLQTKKKRLVFDTIDEVKDYLEEQREEAKQSQSLPITVEDGKPVIKAKPQWVGVKTDDEDVRKLIEATNRKIQADHDRAVSILLKLAVAQFEEDDDMEVILLTL